MTLRIEEFDYELPPDRIAQEPVEPRDAARLLVLHRSTGEMEHRIFRDLPRYLRPGDALVVNESRVLPARLRGRRQPTGGKVELLLLRELAPDRWEALGRPGKRLRPGTRVAFGEGRLEGTVEEVTEAGTRIVRFSAPVRPLLSELGEVPLPPYIHRPLEDPERYQTVYARPEGSAAAPTAGLHFTPRLLAELEGMGVQIHRVVLHVGIDTFRPLPEGEVEGHRMHAEWIRIDAETAEALNRVRAQGGRIVAVGTTSVRVLETAADEAGRLRPFEGWTRLFIYPGYRFRAVDALITNFHLPRTTLILLVAAFAGRERVLRAYREAVARGYRFYSFGDAMLIL